MDVLDALGPCASSIVCVVATFIGVVFLFAFKIINLLALACPFSLGDCCIEAVILEAEDRLASFLGVELASWVAVLVGRS